MRITGGKLSRRIIQTPKQGVRPTQERVREAVFAALGPALTGARVLDCFAGTGAMGLEAWSRGAAEVDWIESDARTFALLQTNVTTLCGPSAARHCHRADVWSWLQRPAVHPYDFILADPPYVAHSRDFDWNEWLRLVRANGWLRRDGWVLLEERAGANWEPAPGWMTQRDKTYGRTRVRLLQWAGAE